MVSSAQQSRTAPRAAGRGSAALILSLCSLLIWNFPTQASDAPCGRSDVRVIEARPFLQVSGHVVEVVSVTVACIGCHDGTVASPVSTQDQTHLSSSEIRMATSTPGSNHPVGMLYPVYEEGIMPVADLDSRLALADGRVTCLTCHAKPSAPNVLTVPNSRSRLCLSCHMK